MNVRYGVVRASKKAGCPRIQKSVCSEGMMRYGMVVVWYDKVCGAVKVV